jgi:hypothetical protein
MERPNPYQPENAGVKKPDPQQAPQEGGNGSRGIPATIHEQAQRAPERREGQQPQGVWEYLERSEKYEDWLRGLEAGTRKPEEYPDRIRETARQIIFRQRVIQDGTPYEKLILKLYETKIELWSTTPRYSLASLEELGQFRSKYETMPEEQLPEEIRKQEKENRRKWLATATPEEKRKDWSRRYRQRRKEKRRLQEDQ